MAGEDDGLLHCSKGAGRADALLHSARQFVEEFVGPFRQTYHFEFLIDDGFALGTRKASKLKPEANILAYRAPRQKRNNWPAEVFGRPRHHISTRRSSKCRGRNSTGSALASGASSSVMAASTGSAMSTPISSPSCDPAGLHHRMVGRRAS
jgi:hypothetical protein